MIVLSGPSSATASPTTVDLPASPSSSPVGSSQVLAVGRQVQQGSLKDLASPRGTAPAGSTSSAAGPPDSSGQSLNATLNTDFVPVPGPASGATPPNAAHPSDEGDRPALPHAAATVDPHADPDPDPYADANPDPHAGHPHRHAFGDVHGHSLIHHFPDAHPVAPTP